MTLGIPEDTWQRTQQQGTQGEADFVTAVNNLGSLFEIKSASKNQNMYEHIDYFVRQPSGKVSSFDVKSYKGSTSNDKVLLEFKNVRGNAGWLYGKADYIAFQQKGILFLCVSRQELAELGERLCNLDNKVDRFNDCLYKGYTRSRWGRDDLVSCITKDDLIENCNTFWI